MINEKKVILQYDKPEILLDELSIADEGRADDVEAVKNSRDKQEQSFGAIVPYININSYNIKSIEYLKIDMNGDIPELFMTFKIFETQFLFSGFPKDGDLLCLYIKSTSEVYKPIRHDYTIVEVSSNIPEQISGMPISSKSTSVYYTFAIKAQLRIPKLFQHLCKSYSNSTSWETLRKVAKELKLGFASNEKNTNDKMNWISPNLTQLWFIDNVVNNSWKGEDDAFEWWIDPYYNLNFVNINKQLFGPDSNDGIDYIIPDYGSSMGVMGGFDSTQKNTEFEIPLIITNDPYYSKYPFFIQSYQIGNKSGYVTNKYGYKTIIQFYDSRFSTNVPKNKYIKYSIESKTPDKLGDNEIILRGRPNEKIYEDEYKKEWVGTKYFENSHENSQNAPIQNLINKMENYKIYLDVHLSSYVPWIYRGQIVPVRIVHTGASDIAGQQFDLPPDQMNKLGETELNQFLSGRYIILGTSIEYRNGEMKTILRLGKRHWSINDGIASTPEPILT